MAATSPLYNQLKVLWNLSHPFSLLSEFRMWDLSLIFDCEIIGCWTILLVGWSKCDRIRGTYSSIGKTHQTHCHKVFFFFFFFYFCIYQLMSFCVLFISALHYLRVLVWERDLFVLIDLTLLFFYFLRDELNSHLEHCGFLSLKLLTFLYACVRRVGLPLVFKSSFDKANRTSSKSFRGPGMAEGLKVYLCFSSLIFIFLRCSLSIDD